MTQLQTAFKTGAHSSEPFKKGNGPDYTLLYSTLPYHSILRHDILHYYIPHHEKARALTNSLGQFRAARAPDRKVIDAGAEVRELHAEHHGGGAAKVGLPGTWMGDLPSF